MVQQPDVMNMNLGSSNLLASGARTFPADTSVPESSLLSYQSNFQISAGNQKVMQDHGSGTVFSAPGASPKRGMLHSYADTMNSKMSSAHVKRENQDGQSSPMESLSKRGLSNFVVGLDGSQQQLMEGFNAESQWKNSLLQLQSVGRGIQLPNGAGIQKYPQQFFDGSFNQDGGAMPFIMGQPGMTYHSKEEPVESGRPNKYEISMLDSDIHPQQKSRLQHQRLPQQFTRSSFPPAPWNNLGQSLDNSRKEEQFQRRKLEQSPRVSGAGALPQYPLSSKAGEFSSGSMGGQYALGSSQRDKSAATSVPTGGGSLTYSANDAMQQHQAQMSARRSNSLPLTPAPISGVASPASVSNMTGPSLKATSPLVGKE